MIPVHQVNLRARDDSLPEEEWGDCFRACLASILELPLNQLPVWHLGANGEDCDHAWAARYQDFLYERFRQSLTWWTPGGSDTPVAWWIATHDQGRWSHCAVWHAGEFRFNPWPGSAPDGSDLGPVVEGCSVYSIASFPQ